MSADDLITEDFWKSVAGDLRGVAARWWEDHSELIIGLSKDEARDLFHEFKNGDTLGAKQELVARMTHEEWVAYRNGTTERLTAIARRRANLYDAVEELGRRALRLIGQVVGAKLGL